MEKVLLFIHHEAEDCQRQELWDMEKECLIYGVSDLWDCPEDAIIGRCLHDADDALDLIELGLDYASKGYSGIEVIRENCPYSEDTEEFAKDYIKRWKLVQKEKQTS